MPPGSAGGPTSARPHLDAGFHFEQAGLSAKAIAAYGAALAAARSPEDRAEAHLRLGRVHRSMSDWDGAVREAREAVRLAEEAQADDVAAEAMNVEVGVYQLRGEFEKGEALALQALARARTPRVRGILLQNRGAMAAQRGDFEAADRLFAESVAAFREAGYELGMAFSLVNASGAARLTGDAERAVDLARQAVELGRRLGALDVVIMAVQNQAHALAQLGRTEEAETLVGEALGHYASTHNYLRQAQCLEIMGTLNAMRPESRETAARCYEFALALAERVGARVLIERLTSRLAALRAAPHAAPLGGRSAPGGGEQAAPPP